jgi:hypothetical protein
MLIEARQNGSLSDVLRPQPPRLDSSKDIAAAFLIILSRLAYWRPQKYLLLGLICFDGRRIEAGRFICRNYYG